MKLLSIGSIFLQNAQSLKSWKNERKKVMHYVQLSFFSKKYKQTTDSSDNK